MHEKSKKLLKHLGYSNQYLLEHRPSISNNLPNDYYKSLAYAECIANFDKSLLSQYDYFMILDIDSLLIQYPKKLENLLKDFDQHALMFSGDKELQKNQSCEMSFGIYSSSFLTSLIEALETEMTLISSMEFEKYMIKEFLPINNEILQKVSSLDINSFDKLFFNYIFKKYHLTGITSLNDFPFNVSEYFINAHITRNSNLNNIKLENKFNRKRQRRKINSNINKAYFIHFLNPIKQENNLVQKFINKNILSKKIFKELKT